MVRSVTERTYKALHDNDIISLSPACYVDFGLDCKNTFYERFDALVLAESRGMSVEELDDALGDNQKLTALVQKYGSNVVFNGKNSWQIIKESGIV
jgi:hypothetical protein